MTEKIKYDYPELRGALDALRDLILKKIISVNAIKNDQEFLRSISNKVPWSKPEALRIYKIIQPFAPQLLALKFDFNFVPLVSVEQSGGVQINATKTIGYDGTGSQFIVRIPYNKGDRKLYDKVKGITGTYWDKDNKCWRVPMSAAQGLKALAEKEDFVIGDFARQMINNIEQNYENSYKSEYIELDIPLKMPFRDYQTMGTDYMAKNERAINGDQMGLGKTPQGIGAALKTKAFPTLVICPKKLRRKWCDEWSKFSHKKPMILTKKNVRTIKAFIEHGLCDVVITNYDGIETFFVDQIKTIEITEGPNKGKSYKRVYTNGLEEIFKAVIIDEAHNCRNVKTLRFKTIHAVCKGKRYIWPLTGSPYVKGPSDIAALLVLTDQIKNFGGYFKFCKDFRGAGKDFFSNEKPQNYDQKLRDLNVKLRSLCFIRREKFQVWKEMPEKNRNMIRVELDNQDDYDHAMINLQSYMTSKGIDPDKISQAMQAELLVQMNVLRQISAKGKLSALEEMVDQIYDAGEKVVVFCWFNDTVDAIKRKYPDAVTIQGRVNGRSMRDDEVENNKKKFMTDPDCKMIIVTYGAGGEGHDLYAANKMIMMELGWTYASQGQAEDRIHRIGQESAFCDYYYLIGLNTIDEHMYKIIMERAQEEQLATGGREQIQQNNFGKVMKEMLKGLVTTAA